MQTGVCTLAFIYAIVEVVLPHFSESKMYLGYFIRNRKVVGSNPTGGSNKISNLPVSAQNAFFHLCVICVSRCVLKRLVWASKSRPFVHRALDPILIATRRSIQNVSIDLVLLDLECSFVISLRKILVESVRDELIHRASKLFILVPIEWHDPSTDLVVLQFL